AANNLLLPGDTLVEKNNQGAASWTWTNRPTQHNQFRNGQVTSDASRVFNFDGRAFTNSLNLRDIQRDIFFNGLPNFGITNYTSFNKGRPGFSVSSNTQFINNLTWVKGKHTFKMGVDVRRLVGQSALGFTTGDNYGDFSFSGNFAGEPFADFLLGTPVSSAIAVVSRDNDGRAWHYKTYFQDTVRLSSKLTMDLGVRYELHPGYAD
ncbi:MAG: TonB-dependent receptor, partial [Bryobacterales bacterium]|nr:TonB-dependent receptor [Bryobacterales bacterium]